MKRFIIFVFSLFIVCSGSIAQETYNYYTSSYHDRDYVIDLSYNKNNVYTLHIEIESLDAKNYFAGIRVNEKAMSLFVSDLRVAKKLYKDLKSNAQRNNIRSLSQKLDLDTKVVGGYFKQRGKEYIDHSIKPKYSFVVERKNGRTVYLLRMNTGRMISPIFEHIQCSSAEIVFSSEAEIDEFIEVITF